MKIPPYDGLVRSCTCAAGLLAVAIAALLAASHVRAASLEWDGSDVLTPGAQGGSGTWDMSATADWWDAATSADLVWPASGTGNDAIFGGAAGGAVSVSGVTANDITFNTTGYTLAGTTLTLNGTTPSLNAGPGIAATIGAPLAGADGLTKTGAGTITLAGASSYVGPTTISEGTLTLLGNPFPAISGLQLRLDATTGVTLSGSTVTAWADQSGNNRNATGGTSPTYVASNPAFNSRPTVHFNGSSQYMSVVLTFLAGTSTPYTIVGAVGRTSATAPAYFLGNSTNSSSNGISLQCGWKGDNSLNLAQYGNDIQGTVPVYTGSEVACLYGGKFDKTGSTGTAGHYIYYNDAQINSNTNTSGLTSSNSGTIGKVSIIQGGTVKQNYFNGDIGEILVYNAALTNAQRQSVDAYLNSKWGLGLSGLPLAGGDNRLPTGTALSVATGAFLDLNSSNQTLAGLGGGTGTVENTSTSFVSTLTLSPGDGGTQTFPGVMAGGGGLGTVNLVMNGTGTQILSGANTYTGTTAINGGTLRINGADRLPVGTAVTLANVAGATLDLSNNNQTIGSLAGGGTSGGNVALGSGTLGVGNATSTSFAGTIDGSGGLTKYGGGKLTLTAANSYSGPTTISSGTLALSGSGSIASSPTIFVGSGDTLDVSAMGTGYHLLSGQTLTGTGNFSVAGTMTVDGGASVLPGGPGGMGTLSVGSLTIEPGSVLKYDFGSGTNDQISVTTSGGLNLAGGGLYIYQADGVTPFTMPGTYTLMSYTGTLSGAETNLSVLNPDANRSYTFAATGSAITLKIVSLDQIWTGGGNPNFNWSTNANWNSGVAPTNGKPITFGGNVGLNSNNNSPSLLNVAGLAFIASAGPFSLAGNAMILSGDLTNNSAATQTLGMNIGLGGGTRAIDASPGNIVLSGTISDGEIIKTGTGTLALTASNSYGGGTILNGGTLQVNHDGALGSGPLTFNAGALSAGGSGSFALANALIFASNLPLGDATNNGPLTFSGPVTLGVSTLQLTVSSPVTLNGNIGGGSNGLTLLGSSVLTLGGSNTFTGTTTVSEGTLRLNSAATALSGNLVVAGGTVEFLQSNQIDSTKTLSISSGSLNLGSSSNTLGAVQLVGGSISGGTGVLSCDTSAFDLQSGTVSATLGGSAGLTKSTTGIVTLSGNSSYGGPTAISNGILQLGIADALPTTTALSLSNTPGTALDLSGYNQTIGSLAGGGAAGGGVTLGGGTLCVGDTNITTYSGTISGTGSLVKQGSGTLTLTAAQGYDGFTLITGGGTLKLQGVPISPLPANLMLWLDADKGITTSGTAVTSWADQSGNGKNATGGTSPSLVASNPAFNNLPTVNFNGSSQYMNVDLAFLAGSAYTIFAVTAKNSSSTPAYFLGNSTGSNSGNSALQCGWRGDTTLRLAQYNNDLDGNGPAFTGSELASLYGGKLDKSTGHHLYYNDAQIASNANTTALSSSNSGTLGRVYIQQGQSFPNNYFNGDIGEILVYNAALSDADRQAVDAYLNGKWALGISGMGAGGNNLLPVITALTVADLSTLDLGGVNQQLASLTGSGTVTNSGPRDSTLTLNIDAATPTANFSGTLTGASANRINLVKTGLGTQVLSGPNSYTGATTVTAGTLALGATGSIADSSGVNLAAAALLDTSAIASFAMSASQTFTIHLDGTASGSSGRLHAAALNISNAIVVLSVDNPLDDAAYVLADYTSLIGGTFASVAPPLGYSIDYSYNSGTQIALVYTGISAFNTWANSFTNPPLANTAAGADPDHHGRSNLAEFAFDGDPRSGLNDGKVVSKVATLPSDGSKVLTLTLPVRNGATFSGATEQVSALIDGLIYTIQGSATLDPDSWTLVITEITNPADVAAIQAGLPALSDINGDSVADWTYRTFRTPGTVTDGSHPHDFIRGKVVQP